MSGNFFNADYREKLLLLLVFIENFCHGIHQYERARLILQEIDCFISGINSAADRDQKKLELVYLPKGKYCVYPRMVYRQAMA